MRRLPLRGPRSLLAVLVLIPALLLATPARAVEEILLPPELGEHLPEGTVAVAAIPSFARLAEDVHDVVALFDEERAATLDLRSMLEARMPGIWSVLDPDAPAVVAAALGMQGPGVPDVTVIARLADAGLDTTAVRERVPMPVVRVHDGWVVLSANQYYAPTSEPLDILEGLPAGDVSVRIDLERVVDTFGPMLRAMMSMGMASAGADSASDFQLEPESQRSLVEILGEVMDSARTLDLALDYDGSELETLVAFRTLEGSVLAPSPQPDHSRAMSLSRVLPTTHTMHMTSAVDFENVLDLYREGTAVLQSMASQSMDDEEVAELYGQYLEQVLDSVSVFFAPYAASAGFADGSLELAMLIESEGVEPVLDQWVSFLDSVSVQTEILDVDRAAVELREGWTTERLDIDLDLSGLVDPEEPESAMMMGLLEALVPRVYVGHRDGVATIYATSTQRNFVDLLERIDAPTDLAVPMGLRDAAQWAGGDVQQLVTLELRSLLNSAFDLVRGFVDIPLADSPAVRADFATLIDADGYTGRVRVNLESASALILELIEVFERMEPTGGEDETEIEEAGLSPGEADTRTLSRERAAEMAARLLPDVEELRGHEFRRSVPVEVVDDATAQKHFLRRLSEELPRELLLSHGAVYADLGLVDDDRPLEDELLSLLEEQAGGYYDPDSESFYLLDDMPVETAPMIMVHELTHALDDQLYDLDAKIEQVSDSNDRMNAFGSVTEGSGMVVMSTWMAQAMMKGEISADALTALSESEAGQAEKLKQAPAVLANALVVPYVAGPRFLLRGDMMAMATGADPADLDRAFENPPASMEQVLHPEKYWERETFDPPRELTLPDLSEELGEGWSESAQGTLGELDLASLTGLRLDPADVSALMGGRFSTEAATGWDGDRFSLLRRGDRTVTVLAVVFDTEADAQEFVAALDLPEGSVVEPAGDRVVVVCGEEPGRAAALARAASSRLEVGAD